jgi:preprotein translocase subunit SecA
VPTHNKVKRIDHKDIILQTRVGKMKALAKKVKELHQKGQPVLIGTISIENNEVVSTFLQKEGIPHNVLNAKNHEKEGEIIAGAGKRGAVTIATNMAGRGVDIKLGGPNATKAEHDEINDLGGLYVIGTERHEARRIDNQLRGRSGRQGDNGETQFYISLEDDLVRVFGGDNLKGLMGKMGLPEDVPIESKIITKAIESAQERIEGYHFDARKHTLDYDNVLNKQRSSVYEKRNALLFADKEKINNIINELISDADVQIRNNNISLIDSKKEKYKEDFYVISRQSLMQIYDVSWMDHLEYMDNLRQNVNLRAYGQRDPLVEYKRDALRMFKNLESRVKTEYISFITHVDNIFLSMQAEEIKKIKDTIGDISRNDPCPCNSGKKVKKCDCQEYKFLR